MASEPTAKRAIAFFDGQNLYHSAKEAFGYTYPNYDPAKLAHAICAQESWQLAEIRFYTGVHTPEGDDHWHRFWGKKLAAMGRKGVKVFWRELRYQNTTIQLSNGTERTATVAQEKGVKRRQSRYYPMCGGRQGGPENRKP